MQLLLCKIASTTQIAFAHTSSLVFFYLFNFQGLFLFVCSLELNIQYNIYIYTLYCPILSNSCLQAVCTWTWRGGGGCIRVCFDFGSRFLGTPRDPHFTPSGTFVRQTCFEWCSDERNASFTLLLGASPCCPRVAMRQEHGFRSFS